MKWKIRNRLPAHSANQTILVDAIRRSFFPENLSDRPLENLQID
jgi:hypothetical protein